jgi:hypothetical protein
LRLRNKQTLHIPKFTCEVDVDVLQIQHLKQQDRTSSDAVQQGEVSSSKPTILGNEVFGPLLLEVRVLVG